MSMDGRVSETAIITASLRALSNYESLPQARCNDDFAEHFLPPDRRAALSSLVSREAIKKAIPTGMLEYVIARTRYFDEVLLRSQQEKCEQIVILGAGFDTRAYRFQDRLLCSRVYELDASPTQNYKREQMRVNDITVPPNVSFVPVNLETDDFVTLLCECGFDRGKQSLFLMEGLTFYLSHATVARLFHNLRVHSGRSSLLCFDFQTIQGVSELIETGLKGEQIKFAVQAGCIDDFVKSNQYRIVEHVDSEAIEQRFLTLPDGTRFGRIAPMMNILLVEHD
jgi:methyltransferase (TIGR00027 family)